MQPISQTNFRRPGLDRFRNSSPQTIHRPLRTQLGPRSHWSQFILFTKSDHVIPNRGLSESCAYPQIHYHHVPYQNCKYPPVLDKPGWYNTGINLAQLESAAPVATSMASACWSTSQLALEGEWLKQSATGSRMVPPATKTTTKFAR